MSGGNMSRGNVQGVNVLATVRRNGRLWQFAHVRVVSNVFEHATSPPSSSRQTRHRATKWEIRSFRRV